MDLLAGVPVHGAGQRGCKRPEPGLPQRVGVLTQGQDRDRRHAAVAACVASAMADVGFGLGTPARQFKLDVVPLASKRYFLPCRTAVLATLPGYDGINAGRPLQLQDAFPALGGAH